MTEGIRLPATQGFAATVRAVVSTLLVSPLAFGIGLWTTSKNLVAIYFMLGLCIVLALLEWACSVRFLVGAQEVEILDNGWLGRARTIASSDVTQVRIARSGTKIFLDIEGRSGTHVRVGPWRATTRNNRKLKIAAELLGARAKSLLSFQRAHFQLTSYRGGVQSYRDLAPAETGPVEVEEDESPRWLQRIREMMDPATA